MTSCFDYKKIINQIEFEKKLNGSNNVMFLPIFSSNTSEIFSIIIFKGCFKLAKKIYYDKIHDTLHILDYRTHSGDVMCSYIPKTLTNKNNQVIRYTFVTKDNMSEEKFLDLFKNI